MDRKRAAELLPVITAFANGEDIQEKHITSAQEWYDVVETEFSAPNYEWRIKPKAREFIINFWPNAQPTVTGDLNKVETIGQIKVREVLDE